MYRRLGLYSMLGARDLLARGHRPNFFKVMIFPWLIWFKWYVIYGGWRDGTIGLVHGRYVRDMVYQK